MIALSGCSSSKTIKFTPKADEIVKTESLKQFLSASKNPKVVLRVNQSANTLTETENNDYLYNAIENQLLSSGFTVRDRQLFNKIIGNNDNNIDYQKLREKSDTDLIIELTKLDPQILYTTNKYYDNKGNEKVNTSVRHERYGAEVEFKVILIDTNEFAGVYEFNYTPCEEGCVVSKSFKELRKEGIRNKKDREEGYEGVERNELEDFIKDATKKLVAEMRK